MKILRELNLKDLLFIDIETVPLVQELKEGTPLYESWDYKVRHNRDNDNFEGTLNESYIKHSALYAEFAKIVCITVGMVVNDVLKVKSYSDDDEFSLLTEFTRQLSNMTAQNKNLRLAGHAIKGFDIPFIMRRCLVNQIELPLLIDTAHLKPWELTAIDTLELWKGSGFRGCSLINISTALGLTSPKDEMEGGDTYKVYYNVKNGLDLIRQYCEKDVHTVCNVILKCRYEKPVEIEKANLEVKKIGLVESTFNTKSITSKAKLISKVEALPQNDVAKGREILQAISK